MMRSEIEALLDRRQGAWERLDAAALAADHAVDGVVDSPLAGGAAVGREHIERLYATYFTAFTDLRVEPEEVLIDGNRAAVVARMSGTHTGAFMGMAPTGRVLTASIVFIYELEAGHIARERRIYDFTGVLVQVGLLKAKPA
jgi:steroid delta-isomerase-like uncharacterized protein